MNQKNSTLLGLKIYNKLYWQSHLLLFDLADEFEEGSDISEFICLWWYVPILSLRPSSPNSCRYKSLLNNTRPSIKEAAELVCKAEMALFEEIFGIKECTVSYIKQLYLPRCIQIFGFMWDSSALNNDMTMKHMCDLARALACNGDKEATMIKGDSIIELCACVCGSMIALSFVYRVDSRHDHDPNSQDN
jgi:hypothetical protein